MIMAAELAPLIRFNTSGIITVGAVRVLNGISSRFISGLGRAIEQIFVLVNEAWYQMASKSKKIRCNLPGKWESGLAQQ